MLKPAPLMNLLNDDNSEYESGHGTDCTERHVGHGVGITLSTCNCTSTQVNQT